MEPWNIRQIRDDLLESYQLACDKGKWRKQATHYCKKILGDRRPTPDEQIILDIFNIEV